MWSIRLASVILLSSSCIVFGRNAHVEAANPDDLVVDTSTGPVRGGIGGPTKGKNRTVYWFRSIPYGEPPVGTLRFEPPVPKKKWSDILDVSEDATACIQKSDSLRGSEDCLHLKIFTTKLPREQEKKLPVIVFIHGGAFLFGSPNFTLSKPDFILDEDVIVVAPQYRLGIFGFLSTGDMVAPGNNGLKDLILALRWIKENIAAFGGDPDNITIQGQSAGSALVSYLLQTNHTTGLFNRAIMESGTSLCLWSYFRKGIEFATKVGRNLKVNTSDSQSLVDGLRSADAVALLAAQSAVLLELIVFSNARDGLLLGPVVEPEHDGAVFYGKSHQDLVNGEFHDVPVLLGHTSLEAYLNNIPELLRVYLGRYDQYVSKLVPIDMHVDDLVQSSSIGGSIKFRYFGDQLIQHSERKVMEFISDDQFQRPVQESVRLYSSKSPTYYYKFSYEGPLFGVINRTVEGVGHAEDLGYLFDFGFKGSEEDYLMRTKLVRLFTNFAKTGNPTPEKDPLLQNVIWPANTDPNDLECLNIDKNFEIVKDIDVDRMVFWKTLYDQYGEDFDTY